MEDASDIVICVQNKKSDNLSDGVLSTYCVLDLPPVLLIKILSNVNIPVKERVRASRTCKVFYDVLSGPHAFSDVKKLPGPELHCIHLDRILLSAKDTNTRSAMMKRLRSSVTVLDMSMLRFSLGNQLVFALAFQNLNELGVHDGDGESQVSGLEFPQYKRQISKLNIIEMRKKRDKESLTVLLNGLARILDFGAVRDLQLQLYSENDLRSVLNYEVKNLQKLSLSFCDWEPGFIPHPTNTTRQSANLSELILMNVESLKHINILDRLRGDPKLFLSALSQLHLQHLELNITIVPIHDRWFTDLAANSGETLEYLSFWPACGHALDFFPQRLFRKLTHLQLIDYGQGQCLTSLINFIKERPVGLPKMRLQCIAKRPVNETERHERRGLESLLVSETDKFTFDLTALW